MPVEFFAYTELVVMCTDPEFADCDNPRGERHGFAAYVTAEYEDGRRRRFFVKSDYDETVVMHDAGLLASALNARLVSGKLPIHFSDWEEEQPTYGSEAYVRDHWEQVQLECERVEDGVF